MWSRDKWNTLSETYAELTATNPAPVAPANLTSELVSAGIRFEWDENPEASFDYYQFRLKVGDGSWTAWRRIGKNYYFYNIIDSAALAATKPTIYFEVRSVDCFKQSNTSSTSANWGAPAAPTGLQIKGGGSVWTTTGVVLEWTQAEPNGVQVKDWRVKVYTAADVLLRTETATDTIYQVFALGQHQGPGWRHSACQLKVPRLCPGQVEHALGHLRLLDREQRRTRAAGQHRHQPHVRRGRVLLGSEHGEGLSAFRIPTEIRRGRLLEPLAQRGKENPHHELSATLREGEPRLEHAGLHRGQGF